MNSEDVGLDEYQKAYRKIRTGQEKTGFLIHLTAYAVANPLLIAVNLLFVRGFYWFIFPLVGWGLGLTMHYVFAVRLLERSLRAEELKAEHLVRI